MAKTHGLSKTRLYRIWCCMKNRCYNKNNVGYHNYGGRGIRVCDEWLGENGFQNFYVWAIANGYTDELTLDRIDVNSDYSPCNCRWATAKEQLNNTRCNVTVEYNGETKTLKQWADEYGINYVTLHARYRRYNWDFERALMANKNYWLITVCGETHRLEEWAKIKGIAKGTIYQRIWNGWSKEDAIMKPIQKSNKRTV